MPFPGRADERTIAFLILLVVLPSAVDCRICGSVDIKNDLNDMERLLRNCTILTGNLQFKLLERLTAAECAKYSFPELKEVYGFVMFFRVYGLTSLGTWFPNLQVIRGYETFLDVSITLFYVPQLKEIGLKNLRLVEHGYVRISDCGDLCYASTINWNALGTRLKIYNEQQNCPKCPSNCTDGYCWDENTCQNTTVYYQCPHYEYKGECVKKCPKNSSILGEGNKCILNEDCFNLSPALKNFKNFTWFIFNGTCTYTCPSKHMMVNQTTCEWCGENCSKTCPGGEIHNEGALYEYLDCKFINGSLILRINDVKTYNLLEKYLGDVQEISEALKIQRSSAIKSLEFLKKLKRIRGIKQVGFNATKPVSKSLVVLDNNNLAKLWNLTGFNLEIENGGIWFHYNHHLCLTEIKKFAEKVNQNYTDLDVSPTSNGDQAVCDPYDHKEPKVVAGSRNATLKWEAYEGYLVYYKEADKKSSGTCGDDWSVVVGRANTSVVLTNLLPFVKYSYYLMMNSNSSHPYSRTKLYYFETESDDPPAPARVRVYSNAWDSMIVEWDPPRNPGGNLSHYEISYYMEQDNKTFMDERNYCMSMDLLHTKRHETIYRERIVGDDVCVCPDRESIEYNMCSINKLTLKEWEEYNCKSHDAYRTFNAEFPKTHGRAKREYSSRIIGESKVNAPDRILHVLGLQPYRIYVFLVSVCNKPLKDRTLCSEIVMVYNRTLPKMNADSIDDLRYVLEGRNPQLRWSEPPSPNSVIVAYEIEYSSEGMNAVKCLTRAQHEKDGFRYNIVSMPPGNHHVKVRAVSLYGPGKYSNVIVVTISNDNVDLSLEIGVGVLGLVVCFVIGLYFYYRWRKKQEFEQMCLIASVNPDYTGITYVPDEWEIPRNDVEILREIGKGSFGMVFSGFIKSQKIPCAVKTIADDSAVDRHMEFLNEASMMKSFSGAHHVVKLLGVVSQCKPPLVVMELMESGDLKSFLRRSRDSSHAITNNEMYRMAAEIADGMAYLSAKKFVHRDLAARNCMVSGDHTIKIGDFGMTRDIYQSDYYRKDSRGFFPVRWMAPESLADGVFTSDSDVWSYGVVLWEMATLAEQPYQGLANEQVFQFITNRGTLQRPPDCSDVLYEIMHVCWKYRPRDRPQFIDIVNRLQNLVGEDFKVVSYYHNRENEEYRIRERCHNPPVLYAHYDISGDGVNIFNDHH